MSVAKITEVIASSKVSFEDAVRMSVERANKTVDHIQSAWVNDMKIVVDNGQVSEYRVALKVTFEVND